MSWKIEWWIKEAEQNKERLRINKDCLRDLWDNIKHTHIQTEEDQKKKKKQKTSIEEIFEEVLF